MIKSRFYIAISFISILSLIFSCSRTKTNETAYLQKVLSNLSKIKSASYYSTGIASAPGDTSKFTEPNTRYVKIFINPSDTLVGASSALYALEDTTKMTDFYDGLVRGNVNWDEQYVKVDSFQNHPYPFRLVHYPFYTKIHEIIKYSLTTADSIKTIFQDYGDSLLFSLNIYDKHVYFHIKPIVIKNDYIPEDEISRFDIWIRKSDNLPYRMRSKWHHTTFFEACYEPNFNTSHEVDFKASDYFPDHFEIVQFKRKPRKYNHDLEGKTAPDWILRDVENNSTGLKDLKSKVIMIQFTGVGCGPCHQSLPFIKKLVKDYENKDFEFVAIETWSNNIEGLRRYQENNNFNFKFLKSVESVTRDYEVTSVPVFFILDENRVIRKIINGYSKDTTDKEITAVINDLT